MRGLTKFFKENPQVLVLLVISVVLGLGTFIAVLIAIGESGNGKSALEKTYVLRQLRFRDRQVVVLDAQGEDGVGEWNLIARALGIMPVRLDPQAALNGGAPDSIS